MNSATVLRWLGPEWAIPIIVCPIIFGIFAFTESIASSDAKAALSDFVHAGKLNNYLGMLPETIEGIFLKVFGDSHLGRRCLRQSFKISAVTTVAAIALTLFFDYAAVRNLPKGIGDFLVTYQATLAKTQQTKNLSNYVGALIKGKSWLVFLPILWVGWALLPDYVSLLKTRVVLLVLKNTKVSALSLATLVFIDFLLGILFFFGSFALFQFIYLSALLAAEGYWVGGNLTLDFVMFWIIFSAELLFFTLSGLVFLFLPISSLFWASLLPSLWLWAYIAAAALARFAFASRKWREFLVRALDFPNQPIKCLGVLASCGTGIVLVAIVVLYKIVSA